MYLSVGVGVQIGVAIFHFSFLLLLVLVDWYTPLRWQLWGGCLVLPIYRGGSSFIEAIEVNVCSPMNEQFLFVHESRG